VGGFLDLLRLEFLGRTGGLANSPAYCPGRCRFERWSCSPLSITTILGAGRAWLTGVTLSSSWASSFGEDAAPPVRDRESPASPVRGRRSPGGLTAATFSPHTKKVHDQRCRSRLSLGTLRRLISRGGPDANHGFPAPAGIACRPERASSRCRHAVGRPQLGGFIFSPALVDE